MAPTKMTREQRIKLRDAQQDEMEAALVAWVHAETANNSIRLRAAAVAYFGIKG